MAARIIQRPHHRRLWRGLLERDRLRSRNQLGPLNPISQKNSEAHFPGRLRSLPSSEKRGSPQKGGPFCLPLIAWFGEVRNRLYNIVQSCADGVALARTKTGARYRLGPDLMADLADFCAAQDNSPEIQVMRSAVREYIDRRLGAEPALKKRVQGSAEGAACCSRAKRRFNIRGSSQGSRRLGRWALPFFHPCTIASRGKSQYTKRTAISECTRVPRPTMGRRHIGAHDRGRTDKSSAEPRALLTNGHHSP